MSTDTTEKPKIGVFDSGIGGLSVVTAIKAALPEYEVIFRQDEAHFPYGTKSPGQIMRFAEPILQDMVHEGCIVIVVACNTTATTALNLLRQLVSVPLVGVQPLLEAGAKATKSGKIAVCATPTTYQSPQYQSLKKRFASEIRVFEIECRDWTYMDKHDIVDDMKVGERVVEMIGYGVDTIVVSCTRYSWITEKINYVANMHDTKIIFPEETTVAWLKDVLQTLK